ncbi:MAG TPA: hypothetical protein VET88_02500, partial [Gammaproteobacteria bacterium]|nr:hypothetical protein [Gammaproteobacteria bacterium]
LQDGRCGCGSPFPLMALEVCRSNDLVVTPGGRRVYPSYFVHLLDGRDGIGQFQFVQTAPHSVVLRLCAVAGTADAIGQELQARIRADLGADMMLGVERVEAIPRSASGKHRFVIGLPDR